MLNTRVVIIRIPIIYDKNKNKITIRQCINSWDKTRDDYNIYNVLNLLNSIKLLLFFFCSNKIRLNRKPKTHVHYT